MIFSILLTIVLLCLMVYAFLQKKDYPLVGRTLPIVTAVGIYTAWFPESTSRWAQWVGVGRGVDLMLYVWVVASSLLFLVLHLKFVHHQRQLTELARWVAIRNVRVPAAITLPYVDAAAGALPSSREQGAE